MKKFTFILGTFIMLLFTVGVKAQTLISDGFESWTDSNHPAAWFGSKTNMTPTNVVQYTTSVHGGTYAVELINTTTSVVRFSSQPVSVAAATAYTITFWVRGHGVIGTRIWDGAYESFPTYLTINSATWTQQTQTVTSVSASTVAQFIFYVKSTVADIDHIQIDDVTINGPAGASPFVSITAPAYNSTIYSPNVNVQFSVSNFVIGTDGNVKYTVDGGTPTIQTTNADIALTGLANWSHKVVLELVDLSGNSLSPVAKDSVIFYCYLSAPLTKTIYDIQYTTTSPYNSPWMDTLVTTSGIVTGKCGTGFFIQDGTGPWNGIFVLNSTYPVNRGDNVTLTGLVVEYYNVTEIKSLESLTVNSSGNAEPAASVVTSTEVKSEPYEGVLVTITNATCTRLSDGYSAWTVQDGTNAGDTCKIHNLLYTITPTLGTVYASITGPVQYDFSEYKIEPRSAADVMVGINEINTLNANVYPNPATNLVTISAKENLSIVQIYDMQGRIVMEYDFNGTSEIKLNVSELPKGIYNMVAISTKGNSFSTKFVK